MYRGLIIIFAFIIFIFPASLFADDAMTWSDCVKKTAEKNPEIQSAAATLKSSQAKAKAAYSGFLPQISGDVNYNSGNFSAGSSGSYTTNTYSASVSASQNVFAGFHDKALVDQTAANAQASGSNLENTKVKVSYDLKSAFAELLYAQNNSRLQEDIIKRRKENAGMVGLRFEAGMENKGNSLLSDALLGQARYDKRQADRSIEVARQQLAKVIGTEESGAIKIAGEIPTAEPAKLTTVLDIVFENPQYRSAVAQEKAAKAGVTLAKSSFSPTLDFSATAAKQGNSWSMANNNTTYGFNFGIPIFNGANNYFTLKSSQQDLLKAKTSRENIENDLVAKLKRYHADFVDAFEKLKVDRIFLEAATLRANIARNKYQNGLLSFDNWDIIENDLISKQQAVIRSERALYMAEAAWMQAQGKGVFK